VRPQDASGGLRPPSGFRERTVGRSAQLLRHRGLGEHAHTCANYLLKGRGIAVAGRLQWHEWVAAGTRREGVEIVATRVQFLGSAMPEAVAAREEVAA
jgi:single-stranded DNA-binding protein